MRMVHRSNHKFLLLAVILFLDCSVPYLSLTGLLDRGLCGFRFYLRKKIFDLLLFLFKFFLLR